MDMLFYDAEGAVMDSTEFSMTELPPVPDWFQEALTEAGGMCNGKPNIRVVSGLDPCITEFYGGRHWLKYATREHNKNEYTIWHKPDGTKKILSPAEAKIMGKSKVNGVFLPVVDSQIIEHGIPRYFAEYYKPPIHFGDPDEWEKVRYFIGEDGNTVDLMGEFPSEGWYETWFCIENPVVENEVVIKTTFRELDDVVLEFIKFKLEENKERTAAMLHSDLRSEVDAQHKKQKEKLKEEIRDIITDRADRLVE